MTALTTNPIAQSNAATGTAPANHYGFATHFTLLPHHKETAAQYGLSIRKIDKGFTLQSSHGREALENIAAPFATIGNNGVAHLDRKALLNLLNFLRRPVDHTMGKGKKIGHHASRFLTTGKAEIPLYVDDALENAKSLECHLKGQRKMQEDDAWRSEAEIANPKYQTTPKDEHVKLVSALPGTSYDPARGFVLQVNQSHIDGFEGQNQTTFSNALWGAINKVTQGRYTDKPAEIAITAQQLQALYAELNLPEIMPLINASITEEKAQQLYRDMHQDSATLAQDARFQQALDWQSQYLAPQDKLKNLALATSTLTPILKSDAVLEAWKHEFFTEYKLALTSPVEDITQQLDALQLTIRKMQLTGQTSDSDIQALINNSKPLLSFTAHAAGSITEATQHKKAEKLLKTSDANAIQTSMANVTSALSTASVNGIESGEPDGYYAELLTNLQSAFGKGGNPVKQTVVGGFNTWKGFWAGVTESVYDSPPAFVFLASLVTYAYFTKYGTTPEPEAVQQAVDTVFSGWDGVDGSETVIDEQTIEMGRKAHDMLVAEARGTGTVDEVLLNPNVHYNRLLPQPILDLMDDTVSGYLQYRHWVGQDIIASNAMTGQDLLIRPLEAAYTAADIPVNHSSTFKDVSQTVTENAGAIAVDANTFQDGSHATMGGYAIYRGAKYGPGAAKGMTGLAAEFINPVRKITLPLLRPAQNMTAFAVGTVKPTWGAAIIIPKKQNHHRAILTSALVTIGTQTHNTIQPSDKKTTLQNSAYIKPANLTIATGWYGLNRPSISLDKNNIQPLKIALNNLALTLDYSADDIGIEAEAYTQFIQHHLATAEDAIKAYESGRTKNLHNTLKKSLPHIIAAELHFNGRDDIYSALFPEQTDKRHALQKIVTDSPEVIGARRRKTLERHASKKHGRTRRQEKRANFAQQSKQTTIGVPKPDKAISKGTLKYAWGATKAGYAKTKFRMAQTLNAGAGAIINTAREGIEAPICQLPLKKKIAATAATLGTAGVAMDMAGIQNAFVQAASGTAAATTSAATSSLIFIGLNIPQDAALHTVAVGVCMGLGAKWYYAVNRGLKPLASGANEAKRSFFKRKPKYPSNDLD